MPDPRIGDYDADIVFEASGQASMVDIEYGWLRPGGRLVVYSAPAGTSGYLDADSFVTLRVDLPDVAVALDAIDRGEVIKARVRLH